MTALRILIASARYSARLRLKLLLESHPEWEICGEARTGGEAVSEARKLKPDIAILDVDMPGLSGRESTKRMRAVSPNTEILILSEYSSDELLQEVLSAGARGHLLEPDADRDLIVAIKAVANHEPFPKSFVNRLPAEIAESPETVPGAADPPRRRKTSVSSSRANGDQSSAAADPPFDRGTRASWPGRRDGPNEIERMREQLAETIALVEQALQDQLIRISAGQPADLNAQDYITEEFFAVAVRFFEAAGTRSEALPQLCCEIFSHLAPSKYGGLTAAKMARLMSQVARAYPDRYTGELHPSSFLCVNLLACSDDIFGTNHAEKVRNCLLRFANLLLATAGGPSPAGESEIRRMETILKAKPLARESVVTWAPVVAESYQADRIPIAQKPASEEIGRLPDGVPPAESRSEIVSNLTQPTPARLARDARRIFSRIIPSFGKIRNWLTAPIK
jgi:DNA-binding NarL/FixJ family response regulator